MVRGFLGKLGEAPEVSSFDFEELTVTVGRRRRARVKVATDGEVFWMPLPLRFDVAPHALPLIRPPGLALERAQAQAAAPEPGA